MPADKTAIEAQQQQRPELPPAFVHAINEIRTIRKTLLKDPAFADAAQLRQFIGQFVLPLMEANTKLFGTAFVDTYLLAAAGHEEIGRIHETLDDQDADRGVDLDDLNDLQKAFYVLGSIIEKKNDPETKAAYDTCAAALTEFVGMVMEDARDDDDDREEDHRDHDRDDARDDDLGSEGAPEPEEDDL
jgi:hypothetical protein